MSSRRLAQKMMLRARARVLVIDRSPAVQLELPHGLVDATWSALKFTRPNPGKVCRNSHAELRQLGSRRAVPNRLAPGCADSEHRVVSFGIVGVGR